MNHAPTSSPDVSARAADLSIYSETGPLAEVIVHTPGEEMALVSPENRLDLLFDDILFLERAQREHQLMCRVFERAIGSADGVLQISTLLRQTLESEDARHDFVERLCRANPARNLQVFEDDLKKLSPDELHRLALSGQSPLPLNLHPLPNLIFTRDLSAVVGPHLILSHAATPARARESVLMHVILSHHPRFAAAQDQLIHLPGGVTFEGGDLLVVNEKIVLIGHSERTSFGGVMTIAQELFRRSPVEHVLMVDLPKRRYCMHLDTVFTFASPDEVVYFPPLFGQDERGNVVHFSQGSREGTFESRVLPNLQSALNELLETELAFIPCGGDDFLDQQREQWTDGANFFAVAPGVAIGYERNHRTFDVMKDRGYRVISAADFLTDVGESEFKPGDKIAIKLEGNELSRGRGGPRCMTLPLRRNSIPA